MASNHDWVIAASEKERRYAAQKVAEDHQQKEAWFAPIYEELRHGGLEAMLYDLLAHDLGDWRPRKIVPPPRSVGSKTKASPPSTNGGASFC